MQPAVAEFLFHQRQVDEAVFGFADPADARGTKDERLTVFREVRDGLIKRINQQLTNGINRV